MKALVTGGGGFLGTAIVKLLISEGFDVSSLSRNEYKHLKELGVHSIKADITSKDDLEKINFSGYEVVFHVAALAGVWGDYDTYYNINFLGTKYLVNKCIQDKVSNFIYTSTPSVVFGDQDIIKGDESLDYPKKYLTNYAKTKSLAEKYVVKSSSESFKTISIRPHLIWGEGDPHLLPRIKDKAKKDKLKIIGNSDNLVDVIHVDNAAHAHYLAYKSLKENFKLSGRCYFIGQERPVNLWSFINKLLVSCDLEQVSGYVNFNIAYIIGFFFETLYRIIGIKKPEPPITRFVALQLAKSHYFSHKNAKTDLGYQPVVTIEEGLERIKKETQERKHYLEKDFTTS